VTRRLLDLFLVSVLLDAGAGDAWAYTEDGAGGGARFTRSEGLGVASVRMFCDGLFSGDGAQPYRVDGARAAQRSAARRGVLTSAQRRALRESTNPPSRARCRSQTATRSSGSRGAPACCGSSPARSPHTRSSSGRTGARAGSSTSCGPTSSLGPANQRFMSRRCGAR
jgi:hypothetical protein